MKRKTEDPKKRTEPKTNPSKGKAGSGAKLSRDKRGDLVAHKKKDFAGISNETLRQDRQTKAGTGDGTYSGTPAPRVGGKQNIIKSGTLKTATKKVIRQSRKKPSGSPQARRSQKNNRF